MNILVSATEIYYICFFPTTVRPGYDKQQLVDKFIKSIKPANILRRSCFLGCESKKNKNNSTISIFSTAFGNEEPYRTILWFFELYHLSAIWIDSLKLSYWMTGMVLSCGWLIWIYGRIHCSQGVTGWPLFLFIIS